MRILTAVRTDDIVCLYNLINEGIYNYTENDIDNTIKRLEKDLLNKKLGESIYNNIQFDYKYDFRQYYFNEYLEIGAVEIIKDMKLLYVKQIAFLKLVNEGKLMPIRLQTPSQIQIEVKCNGGNKLLLIEFDSYMYYEFKKI